MSRRNSDSDTDTDPDLDLDRAEKLLVQSFPTA